MDKFDQKVLIPYQEKANEYLKDKRKSLHLLNEALRKANTNRGALGKTWENFQMLFGVLRDWTNGNYKEMPTRSILIIILGIVYFVSPIDAIFDYIPFAGLVDDAAVAGFVISQVSLDLTCERTKPATAASSTNPANGI